MNKTKLNLQYNVCELSDNAIPAIIVAAGSSTRMKGINKQFMPILGVPVIARTLMAFETCKSISKIIVVTSADNILDVQLVCEKYSIGKVTNIVSGGSNRHESVIKGINELDISDSKVLIHDGARPFVSGNSISEVVNALNDFDAALCVCKINDTVKKISSDGVVEATVDRSSLYVAQTPQGVDVKKYKLACDSVNNIHELTDDASVMEFAGYSVKAVQGNATNIKITTPDDIPIAEAFVKGESEQ